MNRTAPTIEDMKRGIEKAGGLFYQYRPCRRDVATIYDIENIRHGVVYAQTPLNMNDPFDSMIGFSTKKIFEECISAVMEASKISDKNTRIVINQFLKHRLIGKTAEFFIELNNLKKYLFAKRLAMHMSHLSMETFIVQNLNSIYSKCPTSIKNIFDRNSFGIFSLLVCTMGKIDVTESALNDMLNFDEVLDEFEKKIIETKETQYIPTLRDFLSKLTVSCFSASGWDNQLMWSHYANSYKGICVEYDFTQIKDFIGFIYPVEYTTNRPTLSLYDMGVKGFNVDSENPIEQSELDVGALITYLLAKNTCWSYEKEWRIINVGEPYTPKFINLPCIKSITFGLDIDPICQHLLWDVCQEKGIECFKLTLDSESFTLNRIPLTEQDMAFDINTETAYINYLSIQFSELGKEIDALSKSANVSSADGNYDFSYMRPMLTKAIDMISTAYFMKSSLNRCCDVTDEDLSSVVLPDETLAAIQQINKFILTMDESANSIEKSLSNLVILNKISIADSRVIKAQIMNIKELVSKYEDIKWNPIYLIQQSGESEI